MARGSTECSPMGARSPWVRPGGGPIPDRIDRLVRSRSCRREIVPLVRQAEAGCTD